MRLAALFIYLTVVLTMSGCAADYLMVTPELPSESPERRAEVKSKVWYVSKLAYSPDGRQMASGDATGLVSVWDMANGKLMRSFPVTVPGYGLSDLIYSPDGKLVATSSLGVTRLHDAQTGQAVKGFPDTSFGNELAFSPDGRYIFGSSANVPKQFDLRNNQIVRSFPKYYSVGSTSPDGKYVLLRRLSDWTPRGGPRGLLLVELASGKTIWSTGGYEAHAVAFTPDGKQILVSRSDKLFAAERTISLLDANTGSQIREIARTKPHRDLHALAISPDGKRFVSGTHQGDYTLWNLATGQMQVQLKRPAERISMFGISDVSPADVAFSPNGKLFAITSAASVRLYNSESGEEVAAMIAFDDGEWLVTTPSGYYNASEKGDEYLSVSIAGQPFTTAQLRESFYRPELVKTALAGGTLADYRLIADVKPPPAIAIIDTPANTNASKITLTLQLSDQGGGIGDVRIYRNGSAVLLDSTRNLTIQPSARASQLLRFEIDLESGQNTIRAIAFNADNSMQSTDAVLDVQANIAPRQPALHAVVVGIKDFANPRLALKYSVADAELFASALEDGGAGLYSAVHVRRLLTPEETTSSAIIAALKRARQDVGPDDLFVFYVASHGLVDDGQYLLITSNVGSTSSDHLKQDALSQSTLKELISNIPSSKKLVVLDTCSAGQLGDAIQAAMLTRGMSDDTAMKMLSRAVGSTVLSAATSVQEALEGYKEHGLFTYVIAEGLRGEADANKDGFVKTLELADYVDSQVPELAETVFKHKQYPIVSPTGQGFPLVKSRQ